MNKPLIIYFMPTFTKPDWHKGFTLIELSIVLVIIGLIAGGVLAGRDLIKAAETRAQISQIEKYQQAINTFRGKFGYLPGDIKDPEATQFGFLGSRSVPSQGDGNGVLEGFSSLGGSYGGQYVMQGEPAMVWVDLATAHLIDGSFSTATPISSVGSLDGSNLNLYLPQAKFQNSYLFAWSGGWSHSDGNNYFALVSHLVTDAGFNPNIRGFSLSVITPFQAYAIDKKVDDASPQNGRVLAMDSTGWAIGGSMATLHGDSNASLGPITASDGNATSGPNQGITTTCYDNNNVSGATENYSLGNGNYTNCKLSFKIQ